MVGRRGLLLRGGHRLWHRGVVEPDEHAWQSPLPLVPRRGQLLAVHHLQDGVRLHLQLTSDQTAEDLLKALELLALRIGMFEREPLVGYENDVVVFRALPQQPVGKQILVRPPLLEPEERRHGRMAYMG